MLHDRLRAVMSRADGDPVLIENGTDVVWMHGTEREGKDACLFRSGPDQNSG